MATRDHVTGVEEATHTAIFFVCAEALYRLFRCRDSMSDFSKILTPWEGYDPAFQPGIMFTVAYLLCVAIVVLDVKHHRYAKHAMLRSFLTFQLCLDGITALMMGLGIYLQSNLIMGLAILRMVTGVAGVDKFSLTVQTTKTYIHHVGNFLFLSNRVPEVVLYVAIWRCISMSGHALPSIVEIFKISDERFDRMNWIINRLRTALIILPVCMCVFYPIYRREVAVSAVGHMSYLLVRIGPVFRLGSKYFQNPEDQKIWRVDGRLRILLSSQADNFANSNPRY
eukprot:gene28213-37120_t